MRQIVGVFFGKDEIFVKLCFIRLNYYNFHIFDHNFKTNRYLSRTLIWNTKTEKMPNVTSMCLSHVRKRLLNMTWSNLRFNV